MLVVLKGKKFRRSSVCLPTAVSLKLVLLHGAGQELDTHFLEHTTRRQGSGQSQLCNQAVMSALKQIGMPFQGLFSFLHASI